MDLTLQCANYLVHLLVFTGTKLVMDSMDVKDLLSRSFLMFPLLSSVGETSMSGVLVFMLLHEE